MSYFSHLAVLLEMKSNPMFQDSISESVIKSRIGLLTVEYDQMTAENAVNRRAVTALEVSLSLSLFRYFCVNIFVKN